MKVFKNMKMYTSYLEGLYQHIFTNTPISTWGYFYYDLNGRCLQLMSDKWLLDVFFKNDLFATQIFSNITTTPDTLYASDVSYYCDNPAQLNRSVLCLLRFVLLGWMVFLALPASAP
ncbi:hypothetical protein [Legionella tucsonensis]|uniref:LuxR family transcriptional regulator n=1 Tax=Legionella tucsonensis TaxID=40335 RepID=A0A0W0ZU29_9GAMM|nr:hypothetical protein [Legionella tucsonensis]KTD72685.1 LuxR family transcriptional regulator [Legionella tucsonensis]